jgi:hypothetical protein
MFPLGDPKRVEGEGDESKKGSQTKERDEKGSTTAHLFSKNPKLEQAEEETQKAEQAD